MPLATRHASNIDTTYDDLTIWLRGTSCIPALANGVQPAPRTPPHKRQKLSPSRISPRLAAATEGSASQLPAPPPSTTEVDDLPPQTPNSRKRARSPTNPLATSKPLDTLPPPATPLGPATTGPSGSTPARQEAGKKKPRTNTPWSAEEEQLLKRLRDEHKGWAEIAKDMHHADWTEAEVAELKKGIVEEEGSKWKNISKRVGKPPKACEAYAKEHLKGM